MISAHTHEVVVRGGWDTGTEYRVFWVKPQEFAEIARGSGHYGLPWYATCFGGCVYVWPKVQCGVTINIRPRQCDDNGIRIVGARQ